MTDVPMANALFIGLLTQSLSYGIFLVSFAFCLFNLLRRDGNWRRIGDVHWPMVAISGLFFTFLTFEWGLEMAYGTKALVVYRGPGGVGKAISGVPDWMQITHAEFISSSMLVGDVVLIYRCWIVYGRTFSVIIIPTVLFAANTVCGSLALWKQNSHAPGQMAAIDEVKPFLTPFYVLTIVQNIITTGLIVHRILLVNRVMAEFRPARKTTQLQCVMRTLIESGVLYTVFAVLGCILYVGNSNVFYALTSMEANATGIAFHLIIIRADRQPSDEYTLPEKDTRHLDTVVFEAPLDPRHDEYLELLSDRRREDGHSERRGTFQTMVNLDVDL